MPAPKGHPAYPGCETGGRPVKYTQEFIEKMADELSIWMKDPNNFWLKDFCLDRDLSPRLMSIWEKENIKFSDVYTRAKEHQESKLFKGAVLNAYNPKMVALGLYNHHNWSSDKPDQTTNNHTYHVNYGGNQVQVPSTELPAEDTSSS